MLCFFSCLAWVSPVLFGDSAKTSSLDGCSWVWVSPVLFEDAAKSDPLFGRRCVPPLLWPVAVVVTVSLSLLWLSLLWPVAMAVAFAVAVTVPVRVWVCDAVRLLYGTLPRRPSRNVVCAAMGVGGPPCPHPSKSYLKVHSGTEPFRRILDPGFPAERQPKCSRIVRNCPAIL